MLNVVAVLGAVLVSGLVVYTIGWLVRLAPPAGDRMPFLSGSAPAEHAVSRAAVRSTTGRALRGTLVLV